MMCFSFLGWLSCLQEVLTPLLISPKNNYSNPAWRYALHMQTHTHIITLPHVAQQCHIIFAMCVSVAWYKCVQTRTAMGLGSQNKKLSW